MSTIQIQKELDANSKLGLVSTIKESDFFKNTHDHSSRKVIAEELMGLSWIIFEDKWEGE